MVTLNNGIINIEIAEQGAEIRRVTVNGEERFHNGRDYWDGVAPVLFPVCGGLKNDTYTLNGKSYTMPKHGFAQKSLFELESSSKTSATFILRENEETLKAFPWRFELRITYTVTGSKITVEYDVFNPCDSTMYMSIGGHEAYACPEGVEDYDVIFEKSETFKAFKVEGGYVSREYDIIAKDSNTIPLYNKYFEVDALVFADLKSRFVTLRNRKTGKAVSVEFPGFDYLLLWTKPKAPYICIEPWAGFPSFTDEESDITKKEGINAVAPGTRFNRRRTIYF